MTFELQNFAAACARSHAQGGRIYAARISVQLHNKPISVLLRTLTIANYQIRNQSKYQLQGSD